MTKRLFEIAAIVCCLIAPAFGQGGPTGAISGIVLDSSGGAVPGAEVQIVDGPTGQMLRKSVTNSDGQFIEPLPPASTYNGVVDAHGYAQTKLSNIVVRVTETTRITITVQVGEVKQGVEVSAKVLEVDTTTAVTGQSLRTGTIESLPLSTRNFQQLLVLSTGASSDLTAAGQLGRGDVRINVNGQRKGNNNYLIEGISASDYNLGELSFTPLPSPDAVAEFKVQTSLYDASQGRNGGGNINAILKSGTNTVHGDVYEFFRNTALDANEYFLKGSGSPRPAFQQKTFCGKL